MTIMTLALLAMAVPQDRDVVVMRRQIAQPQRTSAPTPGPTPSPSSTPTPTPPQAPAYWSQGSWGAWTPACNKTSSRTRQVQCVRDGNLVPEAECTGTRPDAVENGGNTVGCTFTPTYSAWSACSNSIHTATIVSCQRSDGEAVAAGDCQGHQQTISETCTVTPQCATMVRNTAVDKYDSYQSKNLTTGQLGPALTEATDWCASKRADACQADVDNGFVLAYFGPQTVVYGPGSSNNGRYAAQCTH